MKGKRRVFQNIVLGHLDIYMQKTLVGPLLLFFEFIFLYNSRFLLVIHFIHISVYMSIPNVWTPRGKSGGGGGVMNWEIGMDPYLLSHIKH